MLSKLQIDFIKKLLYIFFLCIVALTTSAQKVIQKPATEKLVVDYAGVLAPHDAEELERKLVAIDKNSSNQISVVTVNTLNGESLEEVANETFRAWGIGNKKTNNGILLLIAINDRKVKIETGYGLEGAIPDIVANSIIKKDIVPAFKQQNYLGGINAAVDDLAKAAVGEYNTPREAKKSLGSKAVMTIIKIVFILIIIIIFFVGRSGGGGNYPRRNSDLLWPILFNSGGWGSGGSGGGGWSSGDSGFGGFGGGSSGGGGASGSW